MSDRRIRIMLGSPSFSACLRSSRVFSSALTSGTPLRNSELASMLFRNNRICKTNQVSKEVSLEASCNMNGHNGFTPRVVDRQYRRRLEHPRAGTRFFSTGHSHFIEEEDDIAHLLEIPPISWYPGHIAKAEKEIAEFLSKVDVVIEILDARIPFSTTHPKVPEWIGKKPLIVVVGRIDQISPQALDAWKAYFSRYPVHPERPDAKVFFVDGRSGLGASAIRAEALKAGISVNSKRVGMGINPRPVRAAVIGYPNVGKSALINRLLNRKLAKSKNLPGVTKTMQWIRLSENNPKNNKDKQNSSSSSSNNIDDNFPGSDGDVISNKSSDYALELLDSPGILPISFIHSSQKTSLAAQNALLGRGSERGGSIRTNEVSGSKPNRSGGKDQGKASKRTAIPSLASLRLAICGLVPSFFDRQRMAEALCDMINSVYKHTAYSESSNNSDGSSRNNTSSNNIGKLKSDYVDISHIRKRYGIHFDAMNGEQIISTLVQKSENSAGVTSVTEYMITDKLLGDFRKNLMGYGSLEYPKIAKKTVVSEVTSTSSSPPSSSSSRITAEPSGEVVKKSDGVQEGAKKSSQESSREGSRDNRRTRDVSDSGEFDGW